MSKLLLEAGANPDTRTDNDGVPLIASMSYPAVMKLLLDAGADPNQTNRYGESPLYLAIDYGSTDDVQALIDAGSDVNYTDENGQTPLKRADSFNKVEMVEILMKHGATLSGQVESAEVQSASVASPTQITTEPVSVAEDSETAMDAESMANPSPALEPVMAESKSVVAEDNSTLEVAAPDSVPLAETSVEVLQSALDQNPYLHRYQLGLTVVELVNGFATIELTSASDNLMQQAGNGVDLLSVDALSLDLIQDRQAVTALRTALDYVSRKNNLVAMLLLASPADSDGETSIVETEALDTFESAPTKVESSPEEKQEAEEELEAMAAKIAEDQAIAEIRKNLIRTIQVELANLGYDPGPADGIAGHGTRRAIEEYQNTAGLDVDDRPSNELLAHLQSSYVVQKEVAEPNSAVDTLEPEEQTGAEVTHEETDSMPDETDSETQNDDQKNPKKKSGIKGFFSKLLNRE